MKLHIILTISLFFFICALGGSSADDSIPLMPAEFYGTVSIENSPAPVGTTVTALLNGIPIDEIIIIEPGVFGGTGIFDKRLSVIVDGAGTDSRIIQFQVNGISVEGREEFDPGTSKKVELFVTNADPAEWMTTPAVTTLPTQIFTPIETQPFPPVDPFDPYDSFIPSDPYYPGYPQSYNEFQNERIFTSVDGYAQLICYPESEMRTAAGGIVEQATVEQINLRDIQIPQGLSYAGYGYELVPASLSFLPDATFIIHIDDELFDAHPMIMRYDAVTDAWTHVPSLADRFTGTVRATITESGVYGVVIRDLTPIPTATAIVPPIQTETIAAQASVPPPQSNTLLYIAGGILLIIIFNSIVWRAYSYTRKEQKQEEEE
jgi:hypothetical protein